MGLPIRKLRIEFSTDRLKSLTDALYAIAMTLLVLNLEVDEPKDGQTRQMFHQSLASIWPHVIHYVESFLILAAFWTEHHLQFHFIKKTDRRLFWVNLFGLFFITMIPFTTSLVGDYGQYRAAAIIFELNMLAAGLIYYYHWHYATYKFRLVDKELDPRVIVFYKWSNLVLPIISVVAIIVSLFAPRTGVLLYLILPAFTIFLKKY